MSGARRTFRFWYSMSVKNVDRQPLTTVGVVFMKGVRRKVGSMVDVRLTSIDKAVRHVPDRK